MLRRVNSPEFPAVKLVPVVHPQSFCRSAISFSSTDRGQRWRQPHSSQPHAPEQHQQAATSATRNTGTSTALWRHLVVERCNDWLMGLQCFRGFCFNFLNKFQWKYNNKGFLNKNITQSYRYNIIKTKIETLKRQTKPVNIYGSASVIVTGVPNYTNYDSVDLRLNTVQAMLF